MEENKELVSTPVESTPSPVSTDSVDKVVESQEKEVKHTSFKSNLRANLREPSQKEKAQSEKAPKDGTAFAKSSGDIAREATQIVSAPAERAPILPPPDMTPEEKEFFVKADPQTQAYLSRRHLDIRNQENHFIRQRQEFEQKFANQFREVEDVSKIITPELRDEYTRLGVNVPDAIRRSLSWEKAIRTNGGPSAREYLDIYGLTPQEVYPELFNGGYPHQQYQPSQEPGYLTREEAEALADERAQRAVEQKFAILQQEQIAHANATHVDSFMKSKPLFRDPGTAAQVESAMAPVVAALKQSYPNKGADWWLNTAYDYVTKGDPTFSQLTEQLNNQKVVQQAVSVAEQAKQASRSISGSPGSGSPKPVIKDFRENLRRNLHS